MAVLTERDAILSRSFMELIVKWHEPDSESKGFVLVPHSYKHPCPYVFCDAQVGGPDGERLLGFAGWIGGRPGEERGVRIDDEGGGNGDS